MNIEQFVGQCVADMMCRGHKHVIVCERWEGDGVWLVHAQGTTYQLRVWIDVDTGRGMSYEIPYER